MGRPRAHGGRRSLDKALRGGLAGCLLLAAAAAAAQEPLRGPDIVIVTVDTLRFDRVSLHGYPRPTTPHIDALLTRGVRFTDARVPEPLTAPAMVSMLTSLYPHEHGTTRNGLRMRAGLPSLATILKRRGFETAAFVGNWTLKDKLSGLGEHFASFQEVFTRKRWGLWFGEATAEDLTADALAWIEEHRRRSRRPFLVWVHYVEPHEPYRFHRELAPGLGIATRGEVPKADRYDTEVAFVDRAIGELIAGLAELNRPAPLPLVVFASDHGESLGEHGYWGHGRHLYDATLHVPLGFTWEGRIEPRAIDAPASLLDVTPTLLGLLDVSTPATFRGFDWSPILNDGAPEPRGRVTHHQAHKGAVQGSAANARRQGLLEVGRIADGRKEVLRVRSKSRKVFDLERDAGERVDLADPRSEPSAELATWLQEVREGLAASDQLPPPSLDAESLEQLRALGYID